MTNTTKFTKTIVACAFSATVAFATTQAWAAGSHSGGHSGKEAIGEPGKVSKATRSVEIKMFDNYYEPENISVKEGETVRFVVRNDGEFVHEFAIGTAAMHASHQKEMMMMMEHGALEPDKINHKMMMMDMGDGKTMKHDDPNSILLEPGKSGEVVWTFTKAINIEFACNVPGHYEAGMMGKIRFGSSSSGS